MEAFHLKMTASKLLPRATACALCILGLLKIFGVKSDNPHSGVRVKGVTNFEHSCSIIYHNPRALKLAVLRMIGLEWPTWESLDCDKICCLISQNWCALTFWPKLHYGFWHFLLQDFWPGLLHIRAAQTFLGFKGHSWDWLKSQMYTKFQVPSRLLCQGKILCWLSFAFVESCFSFHPANFVQNYFIECILAQNCNGGEFLLEQLSM